jgi:uncharacterized protein (TIRG00374 family)
MRSPPDESRERNTVRTPWWRWRSVQAAASLLLVGLIFGFFFPKLADYGDVWTTITTMRPLERVTLLAVAAVNLVAYWPMLTAVQPGLRLREAAVANLASTAVANTLPGGAALGVGVTMTMQRSWGIPLPETALATVVSGVWNNFTKLGLPIVALGLVALSGHSGVAIASAALIGVLVLVTAIVLFTVLLRSEHMAGRVGAASSRVVSSVRKVFGRPPTSGWDERAKAFRADLVRLLRWRSIQITVATLVSHLSLYAVLLVALRNVGVSNADVSWQAVLAAYAFVRLLSAVPITPGGLGVVELGLTAALSSGLPNDTTNKIAAAVLLYRALTWLLPIPLGLGCWVFWRTNTSWRRTIDERRSVASPFDRAAKASSP